MGATGIFRISSFPYGAFLVLLFLLMVSLAFSMGCSGKEPATGSDEQELARLISDYFSSWSKPDMAAYKECFHAKASVYFIDAPGKPHPYLLDEFIARQEQAHLLAPVPMVERPIQTTIVAHGRMAHAVVRWELTKGGMTATGTNYFTFLKTDKGWKILSLVFEQDKKR